MLQLVPKAYMHVDLSCHGDTDREPAWQEAAGQCGHRTERAGPYHEQWAAPV